MSHSPGPWKWADYANLYSVQEGGGLYYAIGVTRVEGAEPGIRRACTEADARLIAAAPEMLELLRELAAHVTVTAPNHAPLCGCVHGKLAALIARIEGP